MSSTVRSRSERGINKKRIRWERFVVRSVQNPLAPLRLYSAKAHTPSFGMLKCQILAQPSKAVLGVSRVALVSTSNRSEKCEKVTLQQKGFFRAFLIDAHPESPSRMAPAEGQLRCAKQRPELGGAQ